jgi:hypothetical protein
VTNDDFELVHGSGNVFRDFGHPNADLEQARAILAAKIINVLDERKLTVRAAERLTGIASGALRAAKQSRVRSMDSGLLRRQEAPRNDGL